MRTLTAVTLLLFFVPASLAQERGYAGPAELKGLKRVYVQAEGKPLVQIMEKLRRSNTGVEVVDTPSAAELILSFSAEKLKTPAAIYAQPEDPLDKYADRKVEVVYADIERGIGTAYIPSADGGRRVFFIWDGQKKFASAGEKFADAFLKEYRKANGLK